MKHSSMTFLSNWLWLTMNNTSNFFIVIKLYCMLHSPWHIINLCDKIASHWSFALIVDFSTFLCLIVVPLHSQSIFDFNIIVFVSAEVACPKGFKSICSCNENNWSCLFWKIKQQISLILATFFWYREVKVAHL